MRGEIPSPVETNTIIEIIHPSTKNNCAWGDKFRMASISTVEVPSRLPRNQQIKRALNGKKCGTCGSQYELYRFVGQSL